MTIYPRRPVTTMSTSYNSSWPFDRSVVHLQLGVFHMFYKYTIDITYITGSGRKKNKQERTWVVSPKFKKGEVLAFCGYRKRVPERNPHIATGNAHTPSRAG